MDLGLKNGAFKADAVKLIDATFNRVERPPKDDKSPHSFYLWIAESEDDYTE